MAPRTQTANGNGKPPPSVRAEGRATAGSRGVADSLENLLTGMGGARDKSVFTRFNNASIVIQPDQLEAAYRGDWVSRKIIDIPAYDSTREWRRWQADQDAITAIEEVENRFNLKRKLMSGMIKARLYGGAAIIIGVAQGKPNEPINLDTLKKDSLQFIHPVSRFDIAAGPIEYDIESAYYGEPKYYNTIGMENVVSLHPSRVVRLVGYEQPRIGMGDGWGDPVLQVVMDAVLQLGSTLQSIAQLVTESKLDVISIPDLTQNISSPEYEARLKKRFGLAVDAKSIYGMLLLDKEEQWQRIVANFNTLPDLAHLYMETASGAADIPATRMLGQSPRGLNATGVSDIRNYYDRIQGEQAATLAPALERLDEVIIRSALGERPEEIFYIWNPLWKMDEAQVADIAVKKAQTFKTDVDAGLEDPVVLKKARQNQLIEDGTYPGLEQIIEDEAAAQAEAAALVALSPTTVEPPPTPDPNNLKLPGTNEEIAPNLTGTIPPPDVGPQLTKQNNPLKDMVTRVRTHDGRPQTLYVYRPVVNAADIIAHFKKQGFAVTLPADEMHVTIAYSRTPVDWAKAGEAWGQDESGQLKLPPGGMRMVDKFGDAIVLLFASSSLCYRHCDLESNTGATWDWPEYQPHITITYQAPDGLDLTKIEPYDGPIIFGPEDFETVDEAYKEGVVEDAMAKKSMNARRALSDALSTIPPITVNVTVPAAGGKEVTTVTKHDEKGRILEFERTRKPEE